jgi:MoaA/NifB/PqqE/SkfB family radical SAM enzyme
MMCDIWKIRQTREITVDDLKPHLDSLRQLKVRWLVLSGGEPLLHSSLPALCKAIRTEGIRMTLITSGLLLEPKADIVAENFDDVIVSLDGPLRIHNLIRGVPGTFQRIAGGIRILRNLRRHLSIQGRCTVQKANHVALRETVEAAQSLGLNSISFLAADVTSMAFNRPQGWPVERSAIVSLTPAEVDELDREVEALINEYSGEIQQGFIVESPQKLRRIALHFRSILGQVKAVAPPCNAPWVSAVIDSDGSVLPCFFHPAIGNLREKPLIRILNDSAGMELRKNLDIPDNRICQKCVCSLHLHQAAASGRQSDLP